MLCLGISTPVGELETVTGQKGTSVTVKSDTVIVFVTVDTPPLVLTAMEVVTGGQSVIVVVPDKENGGRIKVQGAWHETLGASSFQISGPI